MSWSSLARWLSRPAQFRRQNTRPAPRRPVRWQIALEILEDRALPSSTPLPSVSDFSALAIDPTSYVSDSILVRFRSDAPLSVMTSLYSGTSIGAEIGLVSGLCEVQLDPGVSVADALAAYQANPWVLYAEPNYRVGINLIPNDPSFNLLYGMHNTGQSMGTPDADIDAPEAWDNHTGSGATIVAVIDTGVDYTHPDLAANIWTNAGEIPNNFIDDDGNGFVDDVHGYDFANNDGDPMDDHYHGTHVSGTIGAVGDNGIGVAGVNWSVQIMAVKFLDAGGSGSLANAVRAIDYAVANGALISNNSWGGGGFTQSLYDAIAAAGAQGHIFVAAAGNNGGNNDIMPAYPASYDLDNIIAVAATDRNDLRAFFSNYGATTVDLGAPGVDILSTMPGNTYGYLSGTSMATPHVTGVVALVRDLHPTWTVQQVKDQILSTVDPLTSLAGLTVSGGRVNAAGAATGQPPPDTGGPRISSHSPTSTSQNVSSVRVTFNETINPLTFETTDIASFTGPGGSIMVTGVSPVSGSNNRSFDISFAEQSARGAYTMVIGPDIRDPSGNQMDQDRDGNKGEIPDDRYTARFDISDRLIFPSDDVPAPIYDYTITISYLTINQDVTIADLDLGLDITHTWDADMYIHLYAPDGTNVDLSYFNGDDGDNYTDTIFDDEASVPISVGSAPFTGRFQPETPFAVLDGTNARGTWELWIEDLYLFDEGTLNAWYLSIQPGDGGPPPPPDDNHPPDAVDDNAQTNEDVSVIIAVLANDTDPDGDPLTVTQVSNVQNGSATINANNTVTFTPNPNYYGGAGFTYTISDGRGGTDSAFVSILVLPVNDAPVAVDDSAVGEMDTAITFDGFTGPPRLESNDIDVDGDTLFVSAVGNAVNGAAVLNGGVVTFTPNPGFVGNASFTYTVSDGQLTDVGLVQVRVTGEYLFSTTTGGTLTGTDGVPVTFADADIVKLAVTADGYKFSLFFDGSNFGLTTANEDIDAFVFLADGSLVISTVGSFSVPGPGGTLTGGGEDLLRFTPTVAGDFSSGTWSFYFDGSDVGWTGNNERIDAVSVLSDGRILLSSSGAISVPGVSGDDEDLLAFTPTSLGSNTAGSWAMYFDGSDVDLATNNNEDIDGLFVREGGGLARLFFSTVGDFSVSGVSGSNEDVFAFTPTSLGGNTAGSYGPGLGLDGDLFGLASYDLDGFSLRPPESSGPVPPPPPPPPGPPPPPIPAGFDADLSGGAKASALGGFDLSGLWLEDLAPTSPKGPHRRR